MSAVSARVSIDGQSLPDEVAIAQLSLAMHITSHHEAILLLETHDNALYSPRLDAISRKLGAPVEISLLDAFEPGRTFQTFKGLLGRLAHLHNQAGHHQLELLVWSPTVLLDAGPRRAAWEKLSAKDIVTQVLSGYGSVPCDLAKLSTAQIPYETQFDETDFDFVRRIAGRDGVWLYYDGEKLITQAEPKAPGGTLQIRAGSGTGRRFESFEVQAQIAPSQFKLRSFDNTGAVVSTPQDGGISPSDAALSAATNASKRNYTVPTFRAGLGDSFADAGTTLGRHATSITKDWLRGLVVAVGVTDDPSIRPGTQIAASVVDGAVTSFSGEYVVTDVTHVLSAEAFRCTVSMVPVSAAYPPVFPPKRTLTLHRAKVTGDYNSQEPGAVRVVYADAVDGSTATTAEGQPTTTHARVLTSHGGQSAGYFGLPEIADEVLVAHVGGSASHPVVLGSLYNKLGSPAIDIAKNGIPKNDTKVFLTKSGNTLLFQDKAGQETIEIKSPDGKNVIRLTLDGGPHVIVETQGDVKVTAQKTVTIESTGDMKFNSQGELTISSQKAMTISSHDKLAIDALRDATVKAMNVKVDGTESVKLSGLQLDASGTTTAKLSGAKVDVQGSGMVSVQGALVKIN